MSGVGPFGAPGDAPKHNCDEVLSRLYFFIDNELAEADAVAMQSHIDDCGPCLREIDIERVVKALIARSCCEQAPIALRQRVMFSIHQVQLRLGEPGEM